MNIYSYVEVDWNYDDVLVLVTKANTEKEAEDIFKDRFKDSYVEGCVQEVIFDADNVAIVN